MSFVVIALAALVVTIGRYIIGTYSRTSEPKNPRYVEQT